MRTDSLSHRRKLSPLSLLLCGVLGVGSVASAYAQSANPTPTPLPQRGLLAGTSRSGAGGQTADMPWGGVSLGESAEGAPPITASIRREKRTFLVSVSNGTEDRYVIDLEIPQFNRTGKQIRIDRLSLSLAANQSVTRSVSSDMTSETANVVLTKWKKFEKEKPTAAAETPGPEAGLTIPTGGLGTAP